MFHETEKKIFFWRSHVTHSAENVKLGNFFSRRDVDSILGEH